MMYPFMTLNDDTEITHYSDEEMDKFDEIVHSMAHIQNRLIRFGVLI